MLSSLLNAHLTRKGCERVHDYDSNVHLVNVEWLAKVGRHGLGLSHVLIPGQHLSICSDIPPK